MREDLVSPFNVMASIQVLVAADVAHGHVACIAVLVRDDVRDFLRVMDSADYLRTLEGLEEAFFLGSLARHTSSQHL